MRGRTNMYSKEIIQQALAFAKVQLSKDTTGHDDWHAIRVWKLAKKIALNETCNQFVVELAAILHDIDDWKFNGGDLNRGGDVAREFLLKLGVDCIIADNVAAIITEISFKGANVKTPQLSIEAQIVQDADRLDAIGAIGIARAFSCGNAFKQKIHDSSIEPKLHDSFEQYKQKKTTSINHFYEKLLLLKDRLHTTTAKTMAKEKHQFMESFLKQFHLEWKITEE
jgi:uncharacterized protein